MGKRYIGLIAFLVIFLTQKAGSYVVFTAQPNFVINGFPQPLTLGCSFDDSLTKEPDQQVESIFITRGKTMQRQNETIAFISALESATAKADLGTIHVTGDINSTNHEAYLTLEWQSPGEKQAAVYECKIKTTLGMERATQSISYVAPEIKLLLDKLAALEVETLHKFIDIEKYVKTDMVNKISAFEKSTLQKIDRVERTSLQIIESNNKLNAIETKMLQEIDAAIQMAQTTLNDKISVSEKTTLKKVDEVDATIKIAQKTLNDKISVSEKTTLKKVDEVDAAIKIAQKTLNDKISVSEKTTLNKIDAVERNVSLRFPSIEKTLSVVRERHMETDDINARREEFFYSSPGLVKRLTKRVYFQVPYKKEPIVFVAIKTLWSDKNKDIKINITPIRITKTYFDVTIEAWENAEVLFVNAQWFSYDSDLGKA